MNKVLVKVDVNIEVTRVAALRPPPTLADAVTVFRTVDVTVILSVGSAPPRAVVEPVHCPYVVVAVSQRVAVTVARHTVSVLVMVHVDPYGWLGTETGGHTPLPHTPKADWHPAAQ